MAKTTTIDQIVAELTERRSVAMQTIMLALHKASRYKQYQILCGKLTLGQVEDLAEELKNAKSL